MKLSAAGSFLALSLILAVAAPSIAAQSAADACSLLTQAQVSAAISAQAGPGSWNSPSFKTTCTWTAPDKIVTLMTENLTMYNAAKHPPVPMVQIVPVTGIGDDAFYTVTGNMVSFYGKKGSTAFKMSIYSRLPAATLQSIERTLAAQVASKL